MVTEQRHRSAAMYPGLGVVLGAGAGLLVAVVTAVPVAFGLVAGAGAGLLVGAIASSVR